MITKNMADFNLVNGSRGIVTEFAEKGAPIVRFANGTVMQMERTENRTKVHVIKMYTFTIST